MAALFTVLRRNKLVFSHSSCSQPSLLYQRYSLMTVLRKSFVFPYPRWVLMYLASGNTRTSPIFTSVVITVSEIYLSNSRLFPLQDHVHRESIFCCFDVYFMQILTLRITSKYNWTPYCHSNRCEGRHTSYVILVLVLLLQWSVTMAAGDAWSKHQPLIYTRRQWWTKVNWKVDN